MFDIVYIIKHMGKLNKTLRDLRKQAGISQVALADRLGTSQAIISNYERGMAIPEDVQLAIAIEFKRDDLIPENLKGKIQLSTT
jgi:transcriptional regulator with XRE-family HTH domain